MNILDYFDPGDIAVIIAALIAGFFSFITLLSSRRVSRKANFISNKIGVLQAKSQDQQRIVETIGAQRVVWINNVRQHFVDYNSDAQKLHFNKMRTLLVDNEDMHVKLEKTLEIAEGMSKTICNTELFLNSDEIYSNATISIMKNFRNSILNTNMSIDEFNSILKCLIFSQNVILKAEWKRVKEETSSGDFLTDVRVKEIFDEVAINFDEDMHKFILREYED